MPVRKKSLTSSRTVPQKGVKATGKDAESMGEARPAQAHAIRFTALKKSGQSVTLYKSGKK